MDIIIQELKKRSSELKNFLKISMDHQKELAGAYKYTQDTTGINSFEVCQNLKFGSHESVVNVKTNDKSIIPFHTHLLHNNPPSGNDIIALIYQILNQKSEYSIVIEPMAIYIYTIRIMLMSELVKILSTDSTEMTIDSWKETFINNVNLIVRNYNKNQNKSEYVQKMFNIGIDVRIIDQNS